MYTDNDLRAVFTTLEGDAPDADAVVTALHGRRRRRTVRRRVIGTAAAAAATAALVTFSLTVPSLFDRTEGATAPPTGTPASAHPELLRYTFAVDEIPGYRVDYRMRGDTRQLVWVFAGTSTERPYTIFVHTNGFDPEARGGQPVDVNGRPGFSGAVPCQCTGQDPIPTVAWEYADGLWATVSSGSGAPVAGNRDTLLRIARAVRFDRTAAVRLPVRIGHLPPGMGPASRPSDDWGGWVSTSATPGLAAVYIRLTGPAGGPQLSLSVLPLTGREQPIGQFSVHPDRIDSQIRVVLANLGPFGIQLTGHGLTDDELVAIARSITPAASITDPATWFDAQTAIPGT